MKALKIITLALTLAIATAAQAEPKRCAAQYLKNGKIEALGIAYVSDVDAHFVVQKENGDFVFASPDLHKTAYGWEGERDNMSYLKSSDATNPVYATKSINDSGIIIFNCK